MPVSRRLVFGTIATRLSTISNATGYYGRVGRPIVLPAPTGWTADPQPKSAQDPTIRPYFVLYPGAGDDGPDQQLGDLDEGIDLPWRVTVAGGDPDDVLALADRVDARLLGWVPTLAGHVFGRVTRLPGTQAPLLPDTTISPGRVFVPLQYSVTATSYAVAP